MGDIVIRDATMGTSETFSPTPEGYARAYAYIQTIIGQGHKVTGDVERVIKFMGGL